MKLTMPMTRTLSMSLAMTTLLVVHVVEPEVVSPVAPHLVFTRFRLRRFR